jgi:RNA polymerase sigma-70 factor (ECF subfamily)
MTEDAYVRAVEDHRNRVHSLAFWMLRDREAAKDVAQEALVRMWQHRTDITPETSRSWLLRTVQNLCIDHSRRRSVRSGPPLDDVTPVLPAPGPDPAHAASVGQAGDAIADALQILSPRDRAIVLMREVQGMSYEEIADSFAMPLGTLKASLHRSRERLRKVLVASGIRP